MKSPHSGHGFGTTPVVLAGLGTILGAILFLRFGYAVAHVGLWGALGIVVLGHLVTVPTSLAISELATNRRVEGGGEYFIISRSFGATIGTTIGLFLYLSQAVSVAFYMLAFAESFQPLAPWIERTFGVAYQSTWVSLPSTLALVALMLTRGAALGVRALYVVAFTLGLALASFFLGSPVDGYVAPSLSAKLPNGDTFFVVFAVVFPAFTGMTAGVGLSGDLKDPRRSIPAGTMTATLVGLAVYLAVVLELSLSAPPEALAERQLIMAEIALFGPLIYVGLACATLSSAIGSILVAPRTLQAIGADGSLPWPRVNAWLGRGSGGQNEPRNTTLLTGAVALCIAALGSIDLVARLISMFFMVTYGSLCAISFLEHFAARPSYRPTFHTRWYVSLFGAVVCLLLMFQMDPLAAVVAIASMTALYALLRRGRRSSDDLAAMFAGVMSQLTRYLNLRLQRRRDQSFSFDWRPSIITLSSNTFERSSPLRLMSWLCDRQGFGTYLHHIVGRLDSETYEESVRQRHRLLELNRESSRIFMDTLVSPSEISALAQAIQIPGVAGVSNNTVLLELSAHDPPEARQRLVGLTRFAASVRMSVLVLRHGDRFFGSCRSLHLWITWNDEHNATLMILLAYVLLGHRDWAQADVRVFAALPRNRVEERRREFLKLVEEGRLPLSRKRIRFMPVDDQESFRKLVVELSGDADLSIVGFDLQGVEERGGDVFANHPGLEDVLFVHSPRPIDIG